jgi:hypothetical protein
MSRQRANRHGPDRREDVVTADLVDIGLLFVRVFGRERGQVYFTCTVVDPHVYRRVLLGPHRQTQRRGGTGETVPAE